MARHTAGLKTQPVNGQMNLFAGSMTYLAQWIKVGSIAMDAASLVMT